ncbi:MAG: hypothetical protein ABS942_01595 [Solibacillus sp.]
MTLFLTRYFLNELSGWVLFLPLLFSPFLLLGSLTGSPFYFILMLTMFSCIVVFSKYNESRKHYALTLALAPISVKKVVQADFAFLSWISFCYLSYALVAFTALTLLIEKEFILLSINQIGFIIGCCLLLISLNTWMIALQFHMINALPIMTLLYFLLIIMTDFTLFASQYGLIFFILTLSVTILSYFGTIALKVRRLEFK